VRTAPSSDSHTAAVLAALTDTGVPVGDAQAPTGAGWQGAPGGSQFVPYMVVYPLEGGITRGPVSDPGADIEWPWQVTCVGASRQQAERVCDVAIAALTTVTLTVAGRRQMQPVNLDMRGGVRRDDQITPPLFYATPRFRLWTSPS
jgi:hypothetical protein